MTGEMYGKNFKKKLEITKHFKKQHEYFLIPGERSQNFWYILQTQKVYLMASFPCSSTYSVKNLMGMLDIFLSPVYQGLTKAKALS